MDVSDWQLHLLDRSRLMRKATAAMTGKFSFKGFLQSHIFAARCKTMLLVFKEKHIFSLLIKMIRISCKSKHDPINCMIDLRTELQVFFIKIITLTGSK